MMRSARILVVEDDRVVARDIQQQLRRIGHDVLGTAASGEAAVALALENRPDLVLMDIRLEGEIDGVAAASHIREHCNSPIVFLTAYADDETVRHASRAEPFGYLLKPFEDSQLRTTIAMALYKHETERTLRESARRYVTTLSSIGDAVIATDNAARVSFLNPVAEALTQWSHKEALGRPVAEVFRIIDEETREPVEDPAGKALRLGIKVGLPDNTLLIARNGNEVPVDDCGAPIIDDGETSGAVVVFRDVTRRKQADDALRDAQETLARVGRLSIMGELAASIAHEVNQPLMAVVTNAATCLQWLKDEQLDVAEARKAAERVVRDGHRAGHVVSSIRAMARKSAPAMIKLDLNDALTEVLALLRGELRRQAVSVEAQMMADSAFCLGDRVQIQQVILNLVMNGIEAMGAVPPARRLLRVGTRAEGPGQVELAVTDYGAGLDPGSAERIFEAFFTTKPEGIGIGLSICRSIVEAHGGRLQVSPNLPQGSVFRFTVPAFAGEP